MAETVSQSNEGTVARISVLEERVASIKVVIDERDLRYMALFRAMEEKTSLALTSSDKAVTKAEIAQEKRFDNTNEWRSAMQDRDRNQMPRVEIEQRFDALKSQQNWTVGVCVTLVLGIAALVIKLLVR